MSATLTSPSLRDQLRRITDMAESVLPSIFPDRAANAVRTGAWFPRHRADAAKMATHGLEGMARVKASTEFQKRFPTEAAFDAARTTLFAPKPPPAPPTMTVQGLAASPNPSSTPPPAIRVSSDLATIEKTAAGAGAVFASRLADVIKKSVGNDNAQRLEFSHGGRDYVVLTAEIHPFPGGFRAVKPMRRVAMVDGEHGVNNDAFVSVCGQAKRAIEDRDVIAADKAIRELGSPDGFDTKVIGI